MPEDILGMGKKAGRGEEEGRERDRVNVPKGTVTIERDVVLWA